MLAVTASNIVLAVIESYRCCLVVALFGVGNIFSL